MSFRDTAKHKKALANLERMFHRSRLIWHRDIITGASLVPSLVLKPLPGQADVE